MVKLNLQIKGHEVPDVIQELTNVLQQIKDGTRINIIARQKASQCWTLGTVPGEHEDCDKLNWAQEYTRNP
jgi:hypothetical protein